MEGPALYFLLLSTIHWISSDSLENTTNLFSMLLPVHCSARAESTYLGSLTWIVMASLLLWQRVKPVLIAFSLAVKSTRCPTASTCAFQNDSCYYPSYILTHFFESDWNIWEWDVWLLWCLTQLHTFSNVLVQLHQFDLFCKITWWKQFFASSGQLLYDCEFLRSTMFIKGSLLLLLEP